MTREVTERDFRMPEYYSADPKDYEFRKDGKIVRKDRWETGMCSIASILFGSRCEFEIDDVVKKVKELSEEVEAIKVNSGEKECGFCKDAAETGKSYGFLNGCNGCNARKIENGGTYDVKVVCE